MAGLAFKMSTVLSGALFDSLSFCQPALWGIFFAVLLLFIRDKRQMARVAGWTIVVSCMGTVMGAYGAFARIQSLGTPKMAEFFTGLLLLAVGLIEIYKHELLKIEPLHTETSAKIFRWLRRATLPVFAFFASVIATPCSSGPYPLIAEALSARPGQLIEMYLFSYTAGLVAPFILLLAAWYGVLSLPGLEQLKMKHRLAIRLIVGAATASIGVLLLWHTHAVTLLPGLANIWGPQ